MKKNDVRISAKIRPDQRKTLDKHPTVNDSAVIREALDLYFKSEGWVD